MNCLKFGLISAMALALAACESSEVKMVKGGTLQSCPDKTVEQMVNGYMGNPEWRSLVADDGNDYVNVIGEITYNNKPTKAEIQFRLNKENNTFQFHAWELGNKPASDIVAAVLLEKMCYVELEKLAKEFVELQILIEKTQELESDSVMMKEIEIAKEKCKPSSDKFDGQQMSNVVSCWEKNITNQEYKEKYVIPMKKFAELMIKMDAIPEKHQKIVEKYAMDDPRMAKQKAQSEASIIGSAMRTFRKLLEAFVAETENLNTWKKIGYESPKTSQFSFEQITLLDDFVGAFVVIEGVKATNLVKLADCPALSSWVMQCGLNKEKNVICDCSIKSSNEDACEAITPNFKKLCE